VRGHDPAPAPADSTENKTRKRELMKKTEEPPLHWSQHKEKAAGYWHVKLLLVLYRVFPIIILRIIAFPVGFFYFLFSAKARIASGRFLQKAAPLIDRPEIAKKCRSPLGPLRHIVSFSLNLVEKLESWGGKFQYKNIHFQDDDIGELIQELENGKGVFLITSHLGNMESLRGLASLNRTGISRKTPITAVIDMKINKNFSRMLKELNPQSCFDIIDAAEIGPLTAVMLEEKLAAGEMVSIAGDRTAANAMGNNANRSGKNLMIPFLGEDAPFSQGIFYLAVLMKAPVYFVFAMRRGDLSVTPEYDMRVHKSRLSFECSRKERFDRSFLLAQSFAALLENYCKQNPFQWYNFYDFWLKEA
jgi:predicted LPLAT superfamily acyltransferase